MSKTRNQLAQAAEVPDGKSHWDWLAVLVLILAGGLAYANALAGQFIFDDRQILEKANLHHLWPLTDVIAGSNRPVFDLSLAFNYAWSGTDPFGYHLFNVCVHVLSAILLFFLVRKTLVSPVVAPKLQEGATAIAWAIALLWELHPIQTGAVTYIVQRAESLMGLFFLAAFLCTAIGYSAKKRIFWDTASIAFAVLSVATKEVGVMVPPLMVLYERAFHFGSFKELWQKRKGYYFFLFLIWLVPVYLLSTTETHNLSAGFAMPALGSFEYARSQPGVVLHYLRLLFWPVGLCLDYQWPVANTPEEVLPPLFVIFMLLVSSLYLWKKKPALGFLGAWFFGILSITSSFFPIQDLAFEHRMYLPSIAVIAAVVLAVSFFFKNSYKAVGIILLVAAVMGWLTHERNKVYRDPLTMWQDIVVKRPMNVRAKSDLGLQLALKGEFEAAEEYLQQAVAAVPHFDKALNNLGLLYYQKGEHQRSVIYFEAAIKSNPEYADAYGNLGLTLITMGRQKEGTEYFRKAVALDPENADNFNNLGVSAMEAGDMAAAEENFRKAIRLRPHFDRPYNNLALVLMRQEKYQDAEEYLLAVLRLNPNYGRAWNTYGVVLQMTGRMKQAKACFERAVHFEPNYREALDNLEQVRKDLEGTE